ncbi:unnamed protein product [Musa banksii]
MENAIDISKTQQIAIKKTMDAAAAASLIPAAKPPPRQPPEPEPEPEPEPALLVGQELLAASHRSMHRTWKPWLHAGSTRTGSPSQNSARQMAQSAPIPASIVPAAENSIVGVTAAAGFSSGSSEVPRRWRRQKSRRMAAPSERARRMVQKSAARTRAMLAPKSLAPEYGPHLSLVALLALALVGGGGCRIASSACGTGMVVRSLELREAATGRGEFAAAYLLCV